MTQPRLVTCKVKCPSQEVLNKCLEIAKKHSDLPTVERSYRSFPGGKEQIEVRKYNFVDYFDCVLITNETTDGFNVEFYVKETRPQPSSFWKDLVVGVSMAMYRLGAETSLKAEPTPSYE